MGDSPTNANLGRPDPAPKPVDAQASSAAPSAQSASPFNPAEIGGYRIQRVLGSGGMAVVYAALQTQPKRTVALKVMRSGIAPDKSHIAQRRFKREIEILGKLHHPNIAQVYDAGVHVDAAGDTVPYFVMEYISSAKNVLEHVAARNLSHADRLKLFVKICAGVEHGHRHNVIHRDLKPGNILIDQYGEPKIIDFGVARAAELDLDAQHQLERTEAGHLVGTLKYMAPEQVSKQPTDLDARCDVYALGALLYKLLTGKLPHDFEGKTIYDAVRILREQPPTPPGKVDPNVRGDLQTIIMKAIDPDRTRRYRDAGALGRDVLRYLNHKPIKARRASLSYRVRLLVRRHRPLVAASTIFSIIMLIGAGVMAYERTRSRDDFATNKPPIPWTSTTTTSPDQSSEAPTAQQASADPFLPPSPTEIPAHPFSLREHTARISGLRFLKGPGAPMLASASIDHSACTWDLLNRQRLLLINEFKGPLTQLIASADGARIAAAAGAEPVRIFDSDGRVLQTIRHKAGEIQALALSPDGALLAYAGEDFTLRLVDAAAGRELIVLRSTTGAFTCIAFNRDRTLLAAGSQRNAISVWSLPEGRLLRTLADLEGEIANLAFIEPPTTQDNATSQPGNLRRIAALSAQGKAMIWTLDSDSPPSATNMLWAGSHGRRSNASSGSMISSAFNAHGTMLAIGVNEEVMVWDLIGKQPVAGADGAYRGGPLAIGAPIPCENPPYAIAIDDAGKWLAIGENNGDIRVVPLR